MKHYGIDSQYILAAENATTLPAWDTKYKRSFIFAADENKMYYGAATGWQAWGTSGSSGSSGNSGSSGTSGAGYYATSITSLAIGTGSKAFTTQTGLAYVAGARCRAIYDSTHYMEGQVTSYSGTTLTINVDLTVGSGTYASWTFSIAGNYGTSGTSGSSGNSGSSGSSGTSPTASSGSSGTSGSQGVSGTSGSSGTSPTATSGSSGTSGQGVINMFQASNVTATNLNNTTAVAVPWESEDIKNSYYTHSNTVNNSRITINQTGWYALSYNISMDNAGGAANIRCRIRKDGTTYLTEGTAYTLSQGGGNPYGSTNCSLKLYFTSGTYIEIMGDRVGQSRTWNTLSGASTINLDFII